MGAGPQRMAFIDSMRLLAASLVLLQHIFEGRAGFAKTYLVPLAPGVAGVAIFFFVSGYVIPMATRRGLDGRAFMVRRLFRIYPLYLVALAMIALAGATGFLPKLGFVAEAAPQAWLTNLLLIAEYVRVRPFLDVSWTLAVELVWYGVFAASFVLFGGRAADRLDVLLPVSLATLALVSLAIGLRIPLGRPTMIYAAVLGFQCYRFHVGEIAARQLARSIIMFAVVGLFSNYVAFGIFAHPNLTPAQAIGPWIVATTVFLVWVLYRPVREAPLLNAGLLPALGAMSYSIYLLHPIATATADAYLPPVLHVAGAVAFTFALSWIGFHAIEKPAIALGRRVAGRWTAPIGKAQPV